MNGIVGEAGLLKRTRISARSSTNTTSFQPDVWALGFLPLLLRMRKLAPWIWNGCAIAAEAISHISEVPSFAVTSTLSIANERPLIPII